MAAFVGIDPESDGLARARRLGVPVTSDGIDGLVQMPGFEDIAIVFDATSAGAHARHNAVLRAHSKQIVDLTPAAIGPYLVPAVNFHRAVRSAQREPRHVRRPGHDSDRGGDRPRRVRALRRDRRQHREPIRRTWNAREHRRVHADDGARHRAGRRRPQGQGDHRPESGRPAADHAEHRVLLCRGWRWRGDRTFGRADGGRRAHLRARLSPETSGAVRRRHRGASRAHRWRGVHARTESLGVPRNRGRRPLSTEVRRQPRHHDVGSASHRRAAGGGCTHRAR